MSGMLMGLSVADLFQSNLSRRPLCDGMGLVFAVFGNGDFQFAGRGSFDRDVELRTECSDFFQGHAIPCLGQTRREGESVETGRTNAEQPALTSGASYGSPRIGTERKITQSAGNR